MKFLKANSLVISLVFLNVSICQVNSTNLEHNNVSAHISDAGTFFYDFVNQKRGYEVPKSSGLSPIYSTQIWFAAKDAQGEIHFTQGGMPNEGNDIFNGPISNPGTYSTLDYQNKWNNSIWNICQTDIDNFKLQFLCNLDPNCNEVYPLTNEVIQTINSWPAHGNVNSGQSFYLAPFFDYNSDGYYDPTSGDYPIIKGCCATYMIQNDAANQHSYTNSDSIGIEIHTMLYQYKTWDYLNEATFIDILAINKSNTNYPEFIHSIAMDADIGNPDDDYFGCDSLKNLTYFYNADNDDVAGLQILGYGVNPPAIGIVNLHKNMTSSVPYSDFGLSISNKWNLMDGIKADGSPWFNPNSVETKYVFSGNPNIPNDWSAVSVGHSDFEAKSLSSVNYGSFNVGDTLKQSYAIIYAREGNHLENVQKIIDFASDVQYFFDNESDFPCTNGTMNLEIQKDYNITISPNPTSGIVNIINYDENSLTISVLDLQGKIILKNPVSNSESIQIDLNNQRSGVYFFHFKTQSGHSVKKVIIK